MTRYYMRHGIITASRAVLIFDLVHPNLTRQRYLQLSTIVTQVLAMSEFGRKLQASINSDSLMKEV
jgi:hypothetical protein